MRVIDFSQRHPVAFHEMNRHFSVLGLLTSCTRFRLPCRPSVLQPGHWPQKPTYTTRASSCVAGDLASAPLVVLLLHHICDYPSILDGWLRYLFDTLYMKVATGLRQLAALLRPSPTLLRAVLAPEEVAKSRTAARPLTEAHSSISVARGPSRTWARPGDSAIHSIHSQGDCRSPFAVIVGREGEHYVFFTQIATE